MKKIHLFVSAIVLVGLVVACGNTKQNQVQDFDENTSSTVVEEKPVVVQPQKYEYQPSRTIFTDLIHTNLELTPIWETSQLKGIATITAKPHFYPSNTFILDAKGMTINSVKMNGKPVDYKWENDVLSITLDKMYTRNDQFSVVIDYVANPNDLKKGGSAAIQDDKGLYFINPTNEEGGFMPQIWTQGETESNSVWFPTIDSPNMKSKADIFLTVDNKYKTLSNGKLMASTVNKDGTRTDHYRQDKPISMYLYMIAVGEFSVTKDSYKKADGSKLEVDYYVEPEWEHQAQAIFGNTPEMLKFYKDILGIDYPWDKFSQIVVREYVSGAMENVGAVVFGDFMYRDSVELVDSRVESDAIIAHELFHHWFGDLVTAESWANLTVNESFANYSEYLWNEYKYGLDVAQYVMEDTKQGYFNTQPTHDLVWFYHKHRDDMFDGVSYNKGGAILNQLRGYVGDEAFFAALNLYLTRHQYGTAEAHNLRMAFEEVTGEDLNWYFNDWYYGKGHPLVDITMSKGNNDSITLHFTQQQEDEFGIFTIPMKIAYKDGRGNERIETFKIDRKEMDYSFVAPGDLSYIIIDPDRTLLGIYYFDMNEKGLWMNQFAYGKNYATKKEAIDRLFEMNDSNEEIKAFVAKALDDSFYGTQVAVLDNVYKRILNSFLGDDGMIVGNAESLVDLNRVRFLAKAGTHHEVRSLAIQVYMKSNETDAQKLAFLKDLLKTEKSYNVLATILPSLTEVDSENTEKYLTEFSQKYNSSKIDFALAEYYLDKDVPGKMDFFKKLYKNSSLREKGNALLYMGYYSFSSGLDEMYDYATLVDSVYEQTYRYKKYVAGMMFRAHDELDYYVKEITDHANEQKDAIKKADMLTYVSMMQKVRDYYKEVIDKHSMKDDI